MSNNSQEQSLGAGVPGEHTADDFAPPPGSIMQIIEDAFAGKLPIDNALLAGHSFSGPSLGVVSSDLAKRFMTASTRFSVAAVNASYGKRAEEGLARRCFRCCSILGNLGWRVIRADMPACEGKRVVLGTDWNVYQALFGEVDESSVLLDFKPEAKSWAAEFLTNLSLILASRGETLGLPPAPLVRVAKGEVVIGVIDDERFQYLVDYIYEVSKEQESDMVDYMTDARNEYYDDLIERLSSLIHVIVQEQLPQSASVSWLIRDGGSIVQEPMRRRMNLFFVPNSDLAIAT